MKLRTSADEADDGQAPDDGHRPVSRSSAAMSYDAIGRADEHATSMTAIDAARRVSLPTSLESCEVSRVTSNRPLVLVEPLLVAPARVGRRSMTSPADAMTCLVAMSRIFSR